MAEGELSYRPVRYHRQGRGRLYTLKMLLSSFTKASIYILHWTRCFLVRAIVTRRQQYLQQYLYRVGPMDDTAPRLRLLMVRSVQHGSWITKPGMMSHPS